MSKDSKEIWILSHNTQFNLASKIENNSENIVFKDIIKWEKFENNFPNIFISNVRSLIGKDIIFLASLHDPSVMFEQLSVINTLPRYLINSFTILLPFFPCGTMEKIEKEGQIATAKTVANLLSSIPICKTGPAQLVIYDIHSLQEQFYFGESIIPRLESCITLLHEQINILKSKNEKVAILFPDDGASKRFHRFFYTKDLSTTNLSDFAQEVNDIVFCTKIRYNGHLVNNISQDIPSDYHFIIVDDLVNTGNTILQSAKMCFEKGAEKISVFIIHGVFPHESWKKFLNPFKRGNYEKKLENFWITDSLPHALNICNEAKEIFHLLSLAKLFANLF